jgi:hypothetical protein
MIECENDLAAFVCGYILALGGYAIPGKTWWDWENNTIGIQGWCCRLPENFPGLYAMSEAFMKSSLYYEGYGLVPMDTI